MRYLSRFRTPCEGNATGESDLFRRSAATILAREPEDVMGDHNGRLILGNEFATLIYHVHPKIVHHTFHKPVASVTFREVLTRGVELFESRHATKWLSDDRGNGALHPEDGKWAIEVWSKRAIAAGWKYWAIVMPDAALGKANMRRFIREYADQGVVVAIFDNPEDALGWLKQPSVQEAV